jgi:hypothetical protein
VLIPSRPKQSTDIQTERVRVWVAELAEHIEEPIVPSYGGCHGNRRADNRGVFLADYTKNAREISRQYGFDKHLASVALGTCVESHTLRLEAKKLHEIQQLSSWSSNKLPMGSDTVVLPFDPAQLQRVTIFFHGGSLSSCNKETFKLLRESIPKLMGYFPNIQVLKFDITWNIDEDQEWFGGHYIDLFNKGEISAAALPLIDVPGAQKTCHEFFFLAWQIRELCVRKVCEVEVFSMDRSAVFNGKWENDLEAATYLFPNSNAWNPRGFQLWMEEYTKTHYQASDMDMEGEPVGVEYVDRAADLDPAESGGYSAPPLAKCIAWVKRYPAIIAGQKAAVAREKEEREASYSA